jgi:hypothetical protein
MRIRKYVVSVGFKMGEIDGKSVGVHFEKVSKRSRIKNSRRIYLKFVKIF